MRFDPFPGSAFSDPQRFATRARISVGAEVDVTEGLALAAGLQWNPGTRDDLDLAEGDAKQDFLVATVGSAYRIGRVRSGLSLFYGRSDTPYKAFNVPGNDSRFRMRAYGASLVFSYALGEPAAVPPSTEMVPAPL
mgnify:CR=1 FL=1